MIAEVANATPRPELHRPTFVRELLETLILIGLVYTLVNLATVRFYIEGPSMQPNFWAGQFLVVSRANYLLGGPQRGDIVVFDPPIPDGQTETPDSPLLIKRLIGLPGDHLEFRDHQLYINGVQLYEPYIAEPCTNSCAEGSWDLGPNEYFFMGDNRNNSRDSRVFGPVTKDRIIGEAVVRYWPPDAWGLVSHYLFPEP